LVFDLSIAHDSTTTRMHGEFLRLLFLQAHWETEAHFTAAGMSSQTNNSEALRFKRAAFYNGLKSKVGLAAAKAAALRVNLNVQGCGIVAPPMHAPSRTPLLISLLLSHNLPTPRVHECVMSRLIHTGLGSSSLIAHVCLSSALLNAKTAFRREKVSFINENTPRAPTGTKNTRKPARLAILNQKGP